MTCECCQVTAIKNSTQPASFFLPVFLACDRVTKELLFPLPFFICHLPSFLKKVSLSMASSSLPSTDPAHLFGRRRRYNLFPSIRLVS